MTTEAILQLPHIYQYSIEDLITKLGLYEPILIDIKSTTIEKSGLNFMPDMLKISLDVKQLYNLVKVDTPLLLPCSICQRELVFNKTTLLSKSDDINSPNNIEDDFSEGFSTDSEDYQLFDDYISYFYSNEDADYTEKFELAIDKCQEVIVDKLSSFSIQVNCSFDSLHQLIAFFVIESFPKIDEELLFNSQRQDGGANLRSETLYKKFADKKRAQEIISKARNTLIMKKVGQYPSLADLQFFEMKKYKKILKSNYSELTKAIGLNASGIGVGSFVYLRRIFETLCEGVHSECKSLENWNEDEYNKKRFNEKLEYIESFGKVIIPQEMLSIKSKLYGVISKGVHEYSEDECFEMFPHVLLAIELILDKKIQEQERTEKIKKMTSAIINARS